MDNSYLNKDNFSGSDLLDLFKKYNINVDDFISDTPTLASDDSTFYDSAIEEVWGDPLGGEHKNWSALVK